MTEIKFRDDNEVSLEDFMGGDDRACMSAWVSFGNDDEARLQDRKKVKRLINFLYSHKHMTPFESTVFTFRVKTPFFVAREYFRHRSASYNEWSGRYSQMMPEFYIPRPERPLIQEGKPGDYYFVPGSDEQYALVRANQENSCKVAWKAYEDVLAAGVAKEVARNILPLNTYTYFYVTINARNLMHFLGLRNESHALDEIQDVARQMEAIFAEKMPLTYGVYRRLRDEQENDNKVVVDLNDPEKAREQVKEIMDKLNLTVLRGAETILPLKPGGIYRYPDGYDKLPRPIFTEDGSVARAVNDGPKIDLTDDKIPNWGSNVKTNKIVTGTWKNDRPTGNATGPHLNFVVNISGDNLDEEEIAKSVENILKSLRPKK